MSIGISPLRPALDPNSTPTDFSSLGGKGGKQGGIGGGNSGSQGIDPSALLFANQSQSQVNFAPPNSSDNALAGTGAASGNNPTSMIQQMMSLLLELMQMLQGKNPAEQTNNLAAQNSGSSGGAEAGGVEGGAGEGGGGEGGGSAVEGGSGGGAQSPANAATNAASTVPADTGLSGSGDLHLPSQLEPYKQDILDAAKATGMPASVIAGQIWAESRGNLDAATTNVNGKADAGLMQVNADTFKGLQKDNPELLGNADVNNAHDNIMAGALYLRDQNTQFGDMGAALRAYNSGPDKVNKADLSDTGGVGGSSYPADVLKFAKIIESGEGQLPA